MLGRVHGKFPLEFTTSCTFAFDRLKLRTGLLIRRYFGSLLIMRVYNCFTARHTLLEIVGIRSRSETLET
jgi:hypothetical protein